MKYDHSILQLAVRLTASAALALVAALPAFAADSMDNHAAADSKATSDAAHGGSMSSARSEGGLATSDKNVRSSDHPNADSRILSQLHLANQKEIQAAQLADKQGSSQQVKDYAQHMISDHSQADQQLLDIAKQAKVNLITSPSEVMSPAAVQKDADTLKRLQSLSGAQFDQEFMRVMREDHLKVINKVRTARGDVQAGPVRGFLNQLLPKLEQHERGAMSIKPESSQPKA